MGALPSPEQIMEFAAKNPRKFQYLLEASICEESLMGFIKVYWDVLEPAIDLKTGWALEAMSEHLEAVSRGDIKNLLMNVPPGFMKSLMVGVFFPSWEWGPRGMPHLRYITASYAADLATRDNMKARDLLASEQYQGSYGELVQFNHRKKDTESEYHNGATGFRFATGVRGKLTGYRGDRLIVDDPHSVEQAESDLERKKTVRWFADTLSTRSNNPKTVRRIVIMQRLHEGDVSGHILENMPGRYEQLILPMRFEEELRCRTSIGFTDPRTEEGELLFPERFDEEDTTELEEDLSSEGGEYAVAGQLQQRPVPRGGGTFKIDNLVYVDQAPEGGSLVRGWDIAGSIKKTSPYSAGVLMKEVKGILYICHAVRFRKKIFEAEQEIVGVAEADGRKVLQDLPQDPGSAGLSQKDKLAKELKGLNFKFGTESGAKEDRAIPLASYVNAGKVRIVRGPWNKAYVGEMSKFPRGNFKDQIDASSRAYARILKGRPKRSNRYKSKRVTEDS